MEQQPSLKDEIRELFLELKAYFETKYDIARLSLVESTAIISTALLMTTIVLVLIFTLVMFLSLALAFYFGEKYGSNALGFLIVGGGYFLLTVFVIAIRNVVIRKPILKGLIMLILPEETSKPVEEQKEK